jgi:hypothetical protein
VLKHDRLNADTLRKRSRHVGSDTSQLAGRSVLAELRREQPDTELADAHKVCDARVSLLLRRRCTRARKALRVRHERPCRCAAEQRDELASPHSITAAAKM